MSNEMEIEERALTYAQKNAATIDTDPTLVRAILGWYTNYIREHAKPDDQPTDISETADGLREDLDQLIRVCLTNPGDVRGFIEANYPREFQRYAGDESIRKDEPHVGLADGLSPSPAPNMGERIPGSGLTGRKADWVRENFDGPYEMFIDPDAIYDAALKGELLAIEIKRAAYPPKREEQQPDEKPVKLMHPAMQAILCPYCRAPLPNHYGGCMAPQTNPSPPERESVSWHLVNQLFNEVDYRIEHGTTDGIKHLEYVRMALRRMLDEADEQGRRG